MLIYHPAYDVNHCLYRFLLVLENSTQQEFEWDVLKLIDFYLVFPHMLKSIQPLPASLRSFRRVIKEIPDSYEALPNAKRVVFDLENMQNTAMMNLVAKEFIDNDLFHKKIIRRSKKGLPKKLMSSITENSVVSKEWFRLIANELPLVPFTGPNGLKKRSGLLEFRYDVEEG